jgi:hypothetical protein
MYSKDLNAQKYNYACYFLKCKTSSLAVREKYTLRVGENRLPRKYPEPRGRK